MERQKWKPFNRYPFFDQAIHQSVIDIMDIHNYNMDVYK